MMHLLELLAVGAFTAGAAWASIKFEVRHLASAAKRAHQRIDDVENALAGAGVKVLHSIERAA